MKNYVIKIDIPTNARDDIQSHFIGTKEDVNSVKALADTTIYFGEIAGKHSEVEGQYTEQDISIKEISDKEYEIIKNAVGTCFSDYHILDFVHPDEMFEEIFEFAQNYFYKHKGYEKTSLLNLVRKHSWNYLQSKNLDYFDDAYSFGTLIREIVTISEFVELDEEFKDEDIEELLEGALEKSSVNDEDVFLLDEYEKVEVLKKENLLHPKLKRFTSLIDSRVEQLMEEL